MTFIQGARYRWQLPEDISQQTQDLCVAHNIPVPLIQTLLNRNIDTHEKITDFLFTPAHAHVAPASLLHDAQKAVERIKHAIDKKEKILIAGDYDVDGMTSTALMMLCLTPLNDKTNYFLPHRIRDGYGLSPEVIQKAAQNDFTLVITVDNGITAIDAAKEAQKFGVDLIITDHHEPQEILPEAFAIINPLHPACAYPNKTLAGVGVAFKLMGLLYEQLGQELPAKVYELLMLGTIADMVPLLGENRYWVRHGLTMAQNNLSPALSLLKNNARIATEKTLGATDIAFSLAPQLNALGRLQDPRQGVQFLVSNNKAQLEPIAQLLASLNDERKEIEKSISAEIDAAIATKRIDLEHERIIMAGSKHWPIGVIGLVASRLVAQYGRPALLFHINTQGLAKGSGRSIEQFNLFNALEKCRHILNHFGGHACAAGVSLEAQKLPELKQELEKIIAQQLPFEELSPKLILDAPAQLADFNGHFVDSMAYLSPFGTQNKEPVFYTPDVSLIGAPQLLKGAHVKCRIFANGVNKSVIFFNRPELFAWFEKQQDKPFDIAAHVTENYWQGTRSVELHGVDVASKT